MPEPQPNPDADLDQVSDVTALRKEAASRRRELRQVQAERDELRERVDTYDRREVERLAEERFTDPTDVWSTLDLDALRGDDGNLNLEAAKHELAALEHKKPHWVKQAPEPPREPEPLVPRVANGARQTTPRELSFGEMLKGARFE